MDPVNLFTFGPPVLLSWEPSPKCIYPGLETDTYFLFYGVTPVLTSSSRKRPGSDRRDDTVLKVLTVTSNTQPSRVLQRRSDCLWVGTGDPL